MNTRFIIEVYHKDRWGETPMYLSVLGSKSWQVEFGDLYQARFFPTRQNAEKAVARLERYIDAAAVAGYSTYCYDYDESREFHPLWGHYKGRMRSSDMEINVREVELKFV